MSELFEIQPIGSLDSIPDGARCQEASVLSKEKYIPCFAPAVAIVFSPKDRRAYWMCPGCASHNLSNRGALLVYTSTDSFSLGLIMEEKRMRAAQDAGRGWKAYRSDIPNTAGFRFLARMYDGSEQVLEVEKAADLTYTVKGGVYNLIFIWRELKPGEGSPVTEKPKRTMPIATASEHHAPRFVVLRGGSIRDEWKRSIVYQPLPGKLPRLFADLMNDAVAKGVDVPEYEEIMQTLAEQGKVQL
jgi:hypothetical protein